MSGMENWYLFEYICFIYGYLFVSHKSLNYNYQLYLIKTI